MIMKTIILFLLLMAIHAFSAEYCPFNPQLESVRQMFTANKIKKLILSEEQFRDLKKLVLMHLDETDSVSQSDRIKIRANIDKYFVQGVTIISAKTHHEFKWHLLSPKAEPLKALFRRGEAWVTHDGGYTCFVIRTNEARTKITFLKINGVG